MTQKQIERSITKPDKKPSVMAKALRKLMAEPKFHIFVGACIVFVLLVVTLCWLTGIKVETLLEGVRWLVERAQESPLWLFAAIAILPALPVPASPFLILAGVVFTPRFGVLGAVLLAIVAMAINMSWTYWVAAGPGRRMVDRLLRWLEIELPTLSRGNAVRLTLLLRVTPGIPFFLHNLILGFLRVPFRIYLLLSIATSSLFTTGFVVFGEGISSGRGKVAMLAISLILVAAVLASFVRARFAAKQGASDGRGSGCVGSDY